MADDHKQRRFDVRDLIALIGVGLVAYGVWLIYPPAAFIVAGGMFVAGALWSARR